MSPTRADAEAGYSGIQNSRSGSPKLVERRRRVRLRTKWPVCFWVSNAPVETFTTDLSSDGFHCFSPVPFQRDEVVTCTLTMPEISIQAGTAPRRVLECQVRVVRLEPRNKDGHFGIGCRIAKYRILTAAKSGN